MTRVGRIAQDQLRSIVERIERLEEEKQAIADDIKEVYAEAKGNGFDTKTLRAVIRIRKQDSAERAEAEALLDLYLHALGMTPLEEAIEERRAADDEDEATKQRQSRPSRKARENIAKAVQRLGKPVELTEEEKAKGMTAAFEKDGTRMSIGVFPGGKPRSPAAESASDLAGGAGE